MLDVVIPQENEEELSSLAKRLGWPDVCYAYSAKNKDEFARKMAGHTYSAVICTQKNVNQSQFAPFVIQQIEGDELLSALNTNKCHALLGLENLRITQVHCKMAADNGIAFCFGLSSLLGRHKGIEFLYRHSKLLNKYKVPLVLGSFARTPLEMRGYHDLRGLFVTLGIDQRLVKNGFETIERTPRRTD